MGTRIPIKGKRTVPTYTTLRAVSWYAFQLARNDERARLNHMMASMAFDAFTLEAYLNHIGAVRIKFWSSLKRKLSPHEKLAVVSTDLGFDPDTSRRPWQSFVSIFKLRALLVHGETETLPIESEVSMRPGAAIPIPLASWEQYMGIDTTERFLDDTKAMITDLATRAGLPPEEVFAKDNIQAATIRIEEPDEDDSGAAQQIAAADLAIWRKLERDWPARMPGKVGGVA